MVLVYAFFFYGAFLDRQSRLAISQSYIGTFLQNNENDEIVFPTFFPFRIFYHLFLIRPDISDRIFGLDLGPDISDRIFGPDFRTRFRTGFRTRFQTRFQTRFLTGVQTGFQTGLSCYHLVIVWLTSSCPAQFAPNFLFH